MTEQTAASPNSSVGTRSALSLLRAVLDGAEMVENMKNDMGPSALEKLQATDFREYLTEGGDPGLSFPAKILPMRADGTRGRNPATMMVFISRRVSGHYDIEVRHVTRKAGALNHASMSNVRPNMLPAVLKGL